MDNPTSIINSFFPPDGYVGEFGVLTTMTHDNDVLKLIIESFTSKSIETLKTIDNKPYLFLISDSSAEPIKYSEISGLQRINYHEKKKLLHAKTAILKFVNFSTKEVIYRLTVFTGNFTRSSLNKQIEMVWCDDYKINTRYGADLHSVASFINELIDKHTNVTEKTKLDLDVFLEELKSIKKRREGSRFIHSFDGSLQKQFISFSKKNIKTSRKYNYVWFGTPFFQQKNIELKFVLTEVIKELKGESVLSDKSNFFLQTNPSVVNEDILKVCNQNKIEICGVDEDALRVLHSKYIIMSYCLEGTLRNNIIYIGSGNLTIHGFQENHNIETGVLFIDETLYSEAELSKSLFCGEEIEDGQEYNPDEKESEPSDDYYYSVMNCVKDGQKLQLSIVEDSQAFSALLNSDTILYESQDDDKGIVEFKVSSDIELCDTIIIKESSGFSYTLPIINKDGTFSKVKVHKAGFKDTFSLLKTFPNLDPIEVDPDFETAPKAPPKSHRDDIIGGIHDTFPLYNFSQLIEHIARENENIQEHDISYWCQVLKFALIDKLKDEEKRNMAMLGIEKLDTLMLDGFRPDLKIEFLDLYYKVILEIKENWIKCNEY